MKTAILLAIVFAVCILAIEVLRYLLDGKLHTIENITVQYRLPLLAYISREKEKSGRFDRWLVRKLAEGKKNASASPDYVTTALCVEEGTTALVNISANESNQMAEEIFQPAKASVETGDLCHDASFLEKAKIAKRVYVYIAMNKTSCKELDQLLNVCRTHGIDVAGVIATEIL